MTVPLDSPSRLTRFRARHAWLDHLVRAGERYTETHGSHYAAAITYFSVLALVPLLMMAFASVALVLLSKPDLLARLKGEIGKALPAGLDQTLTPVIDQAMTSAGCPTSAMPCPCSGVMARTRRPPTCAAWGPISRR